MARSRLVEVNYHEFMTALRTAGERGTRIERSDKEGWAAYIKKHGVKEASARRVAAGRGSGDVKAVIINDEGDWNGFYVYSPDDQMCLKFHREEG
jgi:hypothetical protein